MKLRRSILLVPAGDERKIGKARDSGADVLMFDLQDSVPFDDQAKMQARQTLRAALAEPFDKVREVNVRVNAVDTPWLHDDIRFILDVGVASVTLPELRNAGDVIYFERLLKSMRPNGPVPEVLLDIETPAALCNLEDIASQATLVNGLMVGVNDYALEVNSSGALFGQAGEPSQDHLSWIRPKTLAVARAYGWTVADALMLKDPRDTDMARTGMWQSKRMGFDGWIILFPPQIPGANEVFSPSPSELEWARQVLRTYEEEQAMPPAQRNATVRRQHLKLARYMIERAESIGSFKLV